MQEERMKRRRTVTQQYLAGYAQRSAWVEDMRGRPSVFHSQEEGAEPQPEEEAVTDVSYFGGADDGERNTSQSDDLESRSFDSPNSERTHRSQRTYFSDESVQNVAVDVLLGRIAIDLTLNEDVNKRRTLLQDLRTLLKDDWFKQELLASRLSKFAGLINIGSFVKAPNGLGKDQTLGILPLLAIVARDSGEVDKELILKAFGQNCLYDLVTEVFNSASQPYKFWKHSWFDVAINEVFGPRPEQANRMSRGSSTENLRYHLLLLEAFG